MRFWESSAIVPLVVPEPPSRFCQALLKNDRTVIVWSIASIEVHSALSRRAREGALHEKQFRRSKKRRDLLMRAFTEVTNYDAVKKRALRLLEVHPLRAADALHLAAALVVFEEDTSGMEFVTFDQRLAEAAEKEGFTVVGPEMLSSEDR